MNAWAVSLVCLSEIIAGCGGHGLASASGGSSGGGAAGAVSGGSSGGEVAGAVSGGSSGVRSSVATNHRPEKVACPQERGPGKASVIKDCSQDSDCTDGTNGRCISPNIMGPLGGSSCSYDRCLSDEDCSANEPCKCRESAALNTPNFCVVGSNCRIDSDCGAAGFCSPSLFYIDSAIYGTSTSGSGSATFGYFCHTSEDRCMNDSDCENAAPCAPGNGCGSIACGYSSENRWDCFKVGTH